MRRSSQLPASEPPASERSALRPVPLPPVNAALPIQLLRARESVMAWFRPHLREHGVTDHQWRILRALAEASSLEMQELSVQCEVQPPSLSRIMPKLEAQGLIQRDSDPGDQRRIVARLTAKGRRLVDTVSEGSAVIYRDLLDALGGDTLEELQSALANLVATLDAARLGEAGGKARRADRAADGAQTS